MSFFVRFTRFQRQIEREFVGEYEGVLGSAGRFRSKNFDSSARAMNREESGD